MAEIIPRPLDKAVESLNSNIGSLSSLATNAKSSTVAAINEVLVSSASITSIFNKRLYSFANRQTITINTSAGTLTHYGAILVISNSSSAIISISGTTCNITNLQGTNITATSENGKVIIGTGSNYAHGCIIVGGQLASDMQSVT